MVHLDARRPGVLVPKEYAEEPHLRLNLSYRFQIPDLEITDRGVQATLSFRGTHFRCQLPWGAVFGITSQQSGDGQVWPEDLPVEVSSHLSAQKRDEAAGPAQREGEEPRAAHGPQAERRARGALVAVAGDEGDEDEGDATGAPAAGDRARAEEQPAQEHLPQDRGEPAAEEEREHARGDAQGEEPPGPRRGHLRLVR
jgi:stringent starvation protein B